MTYVDQFNEESIEAAGTDVQETVRRQFVASIAVAAVLLVGFALAALSPATHREAAAPAAHQLAGVQQPILVPLPAQHFAAATTQHDIELP